MLTLVVVHALGGHAASVPDPVAHVIAATGHLLGAGLWLGCVAVLAMLVWPRRTGRPGDAATLVRALRRPFSWLVGGALLLAVLTGLVTLGVQVRSVDALLTTDYGSSLLAKTALMAAAALFGLANAVLLLRLGRRGGDAPTVRMSRLMAIEVALGVGALLAAAELTASAPPRGPEFAAPRPVRALVLARQVDDVLVGATARPNRVGANVFTVTTSSTRRVYGKPVSSVSLTLRPQVAGGRALTLPLTAIGQDKWTGGTRLGSAGGWQMAVIIRRPGGERLVAPMTWRVEPADRVLPVRHSARRLAPIADLVALILLGGAVALLAALLCGYWLRGRGGTGTIGRSSSSVSKDAI